MIEHLEVVVNTLNEITDTSVVWPQGLMHPGGPHCRLSGMLKPISIGEDEGLVFGRLIEAFRPEHAFIIGNAFGLSSALIAKIMCAHDGKSVVTLDNQSEGDGERCAAVAKKLTDGLGLTILKNKKGSSPQDIPAAVEVPVHQLIFIDGLHAHPQVTKDFEGMLPYSGNQTIFVWHDFWVPGIPQCIEAAKQRGFYCLWIPTSCEMVIGTRDPETFKKLQAMFPTGEEQRQPRSPLVFYWTSFLIFLQYVFQQVMPSLARDV